MRRMKGETGQPGARGGCENGFSHKGAIRCLHRRAGMAVQRRGRATGGVAEGTRRVHPCVHGGHVRGSGSATFVSRTPV